MRAIFKSIMVQILPVCLLLGTKGYAQDPNLSQYHSAPMNINPAFTSHGETNFRVLSNFRSQTIGMGAAYNTLTLSIDGKLKTDNDYSNFLSAGGMIIQENAMDGVYKNTSINGNLACHLTVDEKGNGLSLGLGFMYNNVRVDYSKTSFDNQLSSSGFNMAMPSGEVLAGNSHSNLSACAGLMYSFSNEDFYFNAGASGYRFLKTGNSILNDPSSYINPRYNLHANYGQDISDRAFIDISALHTIKGGTGITSFGATISRSTNTGISEAQNYLNFGLYYRTTGALIPYMGYELGDLKFGVTYDAYLSGYGSGAITPKTIELTLSWKHFADAMRLKFGRFHPAL